MVATVDILRQEYGIGSDRGKPFLLFCRSGGIPTGIFLIRDKYKGSLCGIPATVSNNIKGLDDCNYTG